MAEIGGEIYEIELKPINFIYLHESKKKIGNLNKILYQ